MQISHAQVRPAGARRVLTVLALLGVALAAVGVVPAQAASPAVYQGHTYATGAGAASADKPQSKLWHNAGSWWALMVTSAGTVNVFELGADHVWRDTGTVVDDRTTSTGDALWSAGKLYVASRTGGSGGAVRVHRFSYDAASRTYTREGSPFSFSGGGTESATIDKDSTGKLWVTFTRGSAVLVSHTTNAALTTWSTPFRISGADTSVSSDDISAVVAFDGRIGVLWSDQASHATRFAYHVDGAPSTSWTVETPLAGTGLADDHLNIKSLQGDDQGRLYAAVKTSLTGSTDPVLLVLTRTANGVWSQATTATVADKLTRPQIALDKTNRVLYVLQSTESGGTVYSKSAPLSDAPSFSGGKGATFIAWSGARINNVSTTKDPVTSTTGLVAIATDEFAKRYYHAELALDGGTAPPPPPADTTAPTVSAVTPAAGATGVPVSSAATGTFSEQMDPATVTGSTVTLRDGAGAAVPAAVTYDGAGRTVTLDPTADLTADTSYTARITGGAAGVKDVAGNALAVDRVWSFTTAAAASGGAPEIVTLTPVADSYVTSGSSASNFGTSSLLLVDGSPVTTSFVKFDLSAYAGRTVHSAKLTLRATSSGSTGKQNVKLVINDSWTETGLTYSNRPALSSTVLGSLGPTSTNTSYTVPLVAAGVAGELGGALSVGLDSSSSDGVDLASRETGANAPRLVLELAAVESTPPTESTPPPDSTPPADTTAPTVSSVTPAAGATGVAVSSGVTATFSEAMDAATVNGTSVALRDSAGALVPAGIAYDGAGRTVTLDPSADLAASSTYTATITGGAGGVADVAGNPLAVDRVWSFTTAAAVVVVGAPDTVTLAATADGHVSSDATGTSFGSGTVLEVDGSPVKTTYLKFDLSAYAGRTVDSAVLQLRATGSGSTGRQSITLVTDDSWTETGLTYASRPALTSTVLGSLGPTSTNTSYAVPLTAAGLAGELGDALSLALHSTSTDGVDLASRETGTNAPRLVLTLAP